jgi:hypothetical protein
MATEEEKGFTVSDRRTFRGGTPPEERESPPARPVPTPAQAPKASETPPTAADGDATAPSDVPDAGSPGASQGTGGQPDPRQPEAHAPVDFVSLIISLATQALIHLGDIPDPESHLSTTQLPLARQTIDLISLLEEKTRGNLTPDEQRVLGQVLADLRMRYVQRTGFAV